jgi:hypothetical protein
LATTLTSLAATAPGDGKMKAGMFDRRTSASHPNKKAASVSIGSQPCQRGVSGLGECWCSDCF